MQDDSFPTFIIGLASSGVIGFVSWVWFLWREQGKMKDDLAKLRVEFIDRFPSRDEIDRMDAAIQRIDKRTEDVRDSIAELKVMWRMKNDNGR